MGIRLRITIDEEEYSALLELALSEMRDPEGQLHFLLRRELYNIGLLKSDEIIKLSESLITSQKPINKETK